MWITGFIPSIRARRVRMNYGIKSFTFLLINPESLPPTEKQKKQHSVTKGFKINMISYISHLESKFPIKRMFFL